MKVSTRNQRGRVSGEERSDDWEMRSGWVWEAEAEAGQVLPVSAPSVPVKFYRSCGEQAGGAEKRTRRT